MALDTHNALGYIWNFISHKTWRDTEQHSQLRLNWQKQRLSETKWEKTHTHTHQKQQQENSPPPSPPKKGVGGGVGGKQQQPPKNKKLSDWNNNKTNWKSRRHCKPAKVAFDSTEPLDWHARMIAQPTPTLKLHHLHHIDVRFNKMLLSLRQSLSRYCGTGTAGTD